MIFFVMFNEHKASKNSKLVTMEQLYKYSSIALLSLGLAYFLMQLEFWQRW